MSLSSRKLSLVQDQIPEDNRVKIAFASSDNDSVNQHFGSASQFSIYGISVEKWQLIELVEFSKAPAGHNEDKLKLRVNALNECSAIYCNAIGMSAIKQLLALNVKPINVETGTEIKSILSELKSAWQNDENYWLAKGTINKNVEPDSSLSDEQRLANLLSEEWEL